MFGVVIGGLAVLVIGIGFGMMIGRRGKARSHVNPQMRD